MKIEIFVKENKMLRSLDGMNKTFYYYEALENFDKSIWYTGEENLKRRIRKYYI